MWRCSFPTFDVGWSFVMEKRWSFRPHDVGVVQALERAAGVSPIVAQLLAQRGLHHPDEVQRFLEAKLSAMHDPEQLPGIPEAAERLHTAIREGRRIAVYGDYDADGMTAAALLFRCLRLLDADVRLYIPNRLHEGYGLNSEALETLASQGVKTVVTVDCGIASFEPAEAARRLGLELIVTDHHAFGDGLPPATVLVHPRLPGSRYPFGELCGAGVAFKLAWALCCQVSGSKRVSERLRTFLLAAIGLAAVGTVADVVPLLDENRILVRHGLKSLREGKLAGIEALLRRAGLAAKPQLSSEDVAFTLGPRLNAAGRLGQAQLGAELLTTDSPERADQLAQLLEELNQRRDSLERSVLLAANRQIKERFDVRNDPAFVLAEPGWHPGVIGIVAGRLAEKYHRPVVLIALDELSSRPAMGSGRSACGLDLHRAFAHCRDHLVSHGGHAAAAGLRIESPGVDSFREAFCAHAAATIDAEARVAEVRIDAEATLAQLSLRAVEQIEKLAPFGAGNPRPVLCASRVELPAPARFLGQGERHLVMTLHQRGVQLRVLGFGRGEWVSELQQPQQTLDIAFRPVINDHQGRRSVELHLVDWRPARSLSE